MKAREDHYFTNVILHETTQTKRKKYCAGCNKQKGLRSFDGDNEKCIKCMKKDPPKDCYKPKDWELNMFIG